MVKDKATWERALPVSEIECALDPVQAGPLSEGLLRQARKASGMKDD